MCLGKDGFYNGHSKQFPVKVCKDEAVIDTKNGYFSATLILILCITIQGTIKSVNYLLH